MKRLLAIGFFAAYACSSLLAQVPPLKVNIPFDFAFGKAVLPAGSYNITCANHILVIRNAVGKPAAMAGLRPTLVGPAKTSGEYRLVFQRYGEEYFLSGVVAPHARDGLSVPAGARQKELAARQVRTEPTTIALKK